MTNLAVAGPSSDTWTGAICGTVPDAEVLGAAMFLCHTPPWEASIHVVDATIIGAHIRRAQETLYRGIKGPTSLIVNQMALNWIVEGLRCLPRLVGAPHKWVARQSSHLAAEPLEAPDYAVAHAVTPPVHLALPREHAILLVPGDGGELVMHVPSTEAVRKVREAVWDS